MIVVPDASEDDDGTTELTGFSNAHEEADSAELSDFVDTSGDDDAGDVDGVGNVGTHKPFLTDLEPSDTTGRGIDFEYNLRWNIEIFIRQLKYDMMPVTEIERVKPRLYAANIGVVIYNIHTLTNKLSSPDLALPIDATHQEVLTAIRDVAFTP